MLLRRPEVSLEGFEFRDFIAASDAERALEILLDPSGQVARAFHTHLVDSCASRFRTEVFQVRYRKMSGEQCHLLGLRDFTDQKSLAQEKATDVIREDVKQFGFGEGPVEAQKSLESGWGSYFMSPESEQRSVDSNHLELRQVHTGGVVEDRLILNKKDCLDAHEVESELSGICCVINGYSCRHLFRGKNDLIISYHLQYSNNERCSLII